LASAGEGGEGASGGRKFRPAPNVPRASTRERRPADSENTECVGGKEISLPFKAGGEGKEKKDTINDEGRRQPEESVKEDDGGCRGSNPLRTPEGGKSQKDNLLFGKDTPTLHF